MAATGIGIIFQVRKLKLAKRSAVRWFLILGEVAKLRHAEPQQIIAEAIEIGIAKMWQESVLGKYLDKRISRKKAVQLVGFELVKLAEQQQKVVREDIKWGLRHGKNHS